MFAGEQPPPVVSLYVGSGIICLSGTALAWLSRNTTLFWPANAPVKLPQKLTGTPGQFVIEIGKSKSRGTFPILVKVVAPGPMPSTPSPVLPPLVMLRPGCEYPPVSAHPG